MSKKWFVADNMGRIAGDNMTEMVAHSVTNQLRDEEPEKEWEAIQEEMEEE